MMKVWYPPTEICFFITLKLLKRQMSRPALWTRRVKSTSSHVNLRRKRRRGGREEDREKRSEGKEKRQRERVRDGSHRNHFNLPPYSSSKTNDLSRVKCLSSLIHFGCTGLF
jgi:hypothetical protein